ncbi:Dehydrocurvularin biosynthesis regulator [Colletotrichum sidae]|uniref:Dehydrocurvularin biosynthesis regulator n=1 Tax=Colletotrichum sidae TaxID=1347389 RepID=A0A4R8T6L1_9PEZI|nr:Dehydrocurvularin biosynthesis regulator [Colletotrichum sidae]
MSLIIAVKAAEETTKRQCLRPFIHFPRDNQHALGPEKDDEMSQSQTLGHETPSTGDVPAAKRRKLRKGTQSCWECKRRKARCTFSASTPDVCEACKRRGSDCVGQEHTEEPPPLGSHKHIVDRLGQVEALVGQLLKAARRDGTVQNRRASASTEILSSSSGAESPLQPNVTRFASNSTLNQHENKTSLPNLSSPRITQDAFDGETMPGAHDAISQALLAAWPSQHDTDIILTIPVETCQIIRAPPPPGSHPVIIARRLVTLASFIQCMPTTYSRLEELTTDPETLMIRAAKKAHDLVTSNDELVASLEGIECIMLESLYENYSGNLRRAWLSTRRAITIAQMLGLDRGVTPPSFAGASADAEEIWFRLVQFDRYVSLMLGLPQSCPEDLYADHGVLERCTGVERMIRLCCVASGRILQRNNPGICPQTLTEEVDRMLKDASSAMPAQWWTTPNMASCENEMERVGEIVRFNHHFMHYNILLQLHFPYLLQPKSEKEYDYNRMAAVTASREILSRFQVFRASQVAGHYCRGIDLVIFVAATALSLAHICCETRQGDTGFDGFPFLAHQRLSDRGVLEQTLSTMQKLAATNDAIATKVATLLKRLLAVEEEVAGGGKYSVTSVAGFRRDTGDFSHRTELIEQDAVLKIHLPHLPSIKIERTSMGGRISPVSPITQHRYAFGDVPPPETHQVNVSIDPWKTPATTSAAGNNNGWIPRGIESENPATTSLYDISTEDWALESLDLTFLDSFIEGSVELDTNYAC